MKFLQPRRIITMTGKSIPLVELKSGQEGTIDSIDGGHGMRKNLQNLGVREGVKVKLINRHFMKGPVVILIGKSRVAIGFGMARRIMVRV
jgi:ferrous iron transport protein A